VLRVSQNGKRLVVENLFTLPILDIVSQKILIAVTAIPLESFKTKYAVHDDSIVYVDNIHVKSKYTKFA